MTVSRQQQRNRSGEMQMDLYAIGNGGFDVKSLRGVDNKSLSRQPMNNNNNNNNNNYYCREEAAEAVIYISLS